MMKNKTYSLLIFCAVSVMFLFIACSKEELPENPYDRVDYSTSGNPLAEPDPNSIAGLHKNILFPKCANPGCHDGTFEPDFRTIESSYATLVYQPVNKLTLDSVKIYSQRVIPNNVADSWLTERLVTSTTEYMPSNATRLTMTEIDHFKNWINNGCKDMNGNVAVKPNLQPNIIGYFAADSVNSRIDTSRLGGNPINPFLVDQGMTMTMAFIATDTADGSDATDPGDFTVKQIRFSTDKNNFSGSMAINATIYIATFNAWLVTVPVTSWAPGTTVYFRIYVNDGHHTSNAEFPRNESLDYFKTLYSFYVQ
jgi:hypothetical protein